MRVYVLFVNILTTDACCRMFSRWDSRLLEIKVWRAFGIVGGCLALLGLVSVFGVEHTEVSLRIFFPVRAHLVTTF